MPIEAVTVVQRAAPRIYPKNRFGSRGLTFSVYAGNFPKVVRDALALRLDADGEPIWAETEPITDNIPGIDLVWKPVGFMRQHGFDMMGKRCALLPRRPFAYCHFENIQVLSTKSGLVRTLREYYKNNQAFRRAGYTYEHSMSMSFVLAASDYLDSDELGQVRRLFSKFEKAHLTGEKLPAKQLAKNLWILKPENENRGRGIELVSSYK